MYGRLHLIRNDKLDSGGLERVLRIEPDHEVKNLILGKIQKMPYQTQGGGRKGGRQRGQGRWRRRGWARGNGSIALHAAKTRKYSGEHGTLYKLSPRTSIEKYHVLRSSACSSWMPVQDGAGVCARDYRRKEGREGREGGKAMGQDAPAALFAGSACSI